MSDKIDFTTMDTGWVNCDYQSGWTVSSNIGSGQLKARVFMGILYMCGGASPDTGVTMNLNTEYTVATLPSAVLNAWRNGYTGTTLNAVGAGRSSGSRDCTWVIPGSLEASGANEGKIIARATAATNASTATVNWVQAPTCLGVIPH